MKLFFLFIFINIFYQNVTPLSIFVKISWRGNLERPSKYFASKQTGRFNLVLSDETLTRVNVVTNEYDTFHFTDESIGDAKINFNACEEFLKEIGMIDKINLLKKYRLQIHIKDLNKNIGTVDNIENRTIIYIILDNYNAKYIKVNFNDIFYQVIHELLLNDNEVTDDVIKNIFGDMPTTNIDRSIPLNTNDGASGPFVSQLFDINREIPLLEDEIEIMKNQPLNKSDELFAANNRDSKELEKLFQVCVDIIENGGLQKLDINKFFKNYLDQTNKFLNRAKQRRTPQNFPQLQHIPQSSLQPPFYSRFRPEQQNPFHEQIKHNTELHHKQIMNEYSNLPENIAKKAKHVQFVGEQREQGRSSNLAIGPINKDHGKNVISKKDKKQMKKLREEAAARRFELSQTLGRGGEASSHQNLEPEHFATDQNINQEAGQGLLGDIIFQSQKLSSQQEEHHGENISLGPVQQHNVPFIPSDSQNNLNQQKDQNIQQNVQEPFLKLSPSDSSEDEIAALLDDSNKDSNLDEILHPTQPSDHSGKQ